MALPYRRFIRSLPAGAGVVGAVIGGGIPMSENEKNAGPVEGELEDFEVVAHSEEEEEEAGICITNNSDMLQ